MEGAKRPPLTASERRAIERVFARRVAALHKVLHASRPGARMVQLELDFCGTIIRAEVDGEKLDLGDLERPT